MVASKYRLVYFATNYEIPAHTEGRDIVLDVTAYDVGVYVGGEKNE